MHEWFGQRACCSAAHGGVAMRDAAGSPHTGSPDVGWGGQDPSESQHGRRHVPPMIAVEAVNGVHVRVVGSSVQPSEGVSGSPAARCCASKGSSYEIVNDPLDE